MSKETIGTGKLVVWGITIVVCATIFLTVKPEDPDPIKRAPVNREDSAAPKTGHWEQRYEWSEVQKTVLPVPYYVND